jgi:hypothetical protein
MTFAQCSLTAPDSLRTIPDYNHVFQGDLVTFTTYGGLGDSTSWFALYGEECCVTRLDSNKTGIFTQTVWASDIFYSRIESYCDTTWGASLDLDVYPRPTGIPEISNVSNELPAKHYNLLGQEVSEGSKGFHVIKKRLFFK